MLALADSDAPGDCGAQHQFTHGVNRPSFGAKRNPCPWNPSTTGTASRCRRIFSNSRDGVIDAVFPHSVRVNVEDEPACLLTCGKASSRRWPVRCGR